MTELQRKQHRANLIFAGLAVLLFALLLLATGCAMVRSHPGTPGRQATPFENVLAWNAALANANLAIAQGVIAASETTPPGIDLPTANLVLTAQSKIADADRQLTFILQKGPAAAQGDSSKIQELVAQIRSSATEILSNDAGVKNAKSRDLLVQNAAAIVNLAGQILTTLSQTGVLTR